MRRPFALGAVSAALVCGSSLSATVAGEPVEETITLEYVQGVAERFGAGNPTAEDEAFAAAHPEIAGSIVDGRRSITGEETTEREPIAAEVRSANRQWALETRAETDGFSTDAAAAKPPVKCHTAERYQNHYSAAGIRLFSYHTAVDWCENGKSITKSTFRDWFSNIQGLTMQNPKSKVIHRLIKNSAHQWIAYTGGSIDNCVLKSGCIGAAYLGNQVVHYAGKGNYTELYYYQSESGGWKKG